MPYDAVSSSHPAGRAQPGTKALLGYVLATFGGTDLGIYNPRDVCGNVYPNIRCAVSFHFEGRAGDAGMPVERPDGAPLGHTIAQWLVANHEALGVQEVIWAGRRWDARVGRWATYKGRSDHFDHVHFAQTWDGALHLTRQQIDAVSVKPRQEDLMDICPGPGGRVDVVMIGSDRHALHTYGPTVGAALAAQPPVLEDLDDDAEADEFRSWATVKCSWNGDFTEFAVLATSTRNPERLWSKTFAEGAWSAWQVDADAVLAS